jgi:predicted transcriptional regulator
VVYSEGLSLDGAAVPVGVSCRICERPDCHQRAFPPLGRNPHVSAFPSLGKGTG